MESKLPIQVSIVVPTYNEVANVSELIGRVERAMIGIGWELIYVDDDSPDGTANAVRARALIDRRIRCLKRVGRRGLSSACVEGMLAASAPVIAVMDADLQHDERLLPVMLQKIDRGAELVIGTRYAIGGSVGDWDPGRRNASRLATRASRIVLKQAISDPMSGFFMLRRELVEETARQLSAIGYKILVDIIATSRRRLTIEEVPYTFRARIAGQSKLDEMVVWEFAMLLADKTVGRIVPVRFLSFIFVGGLGVLVHMMVLAMLMNGGDRSFTLAQSTATAVAMVFNFSVNNLLTYRDRRLKGWKWLRGLVSFMLACSIGALANVGVATYLFENRTQWVLAALSGVLVGAVWNYAVTQLYTWQLKK